MDQVFQQLIKRSQPEPLIKIGSPWMCIPIKNDKQARDTTEIHLANQGITELTGFEKFMNLEVLWLNGNNLTALNGLENNFRVKHLYLQDNKIRTLRGSMDHMRHLETLVIYNNELRDLDKNLEDLKMFPYLKELEMFQNPLAEEPYYRLRVIHALPNLFLLDRHVITGEQKRQMEKWAKDYFSDVKIKKKNNSPRKKLMPSEAFSKCERLLYLEASEIIKKQEEEKARDYEFTQSMIKGKSKQIESSSLPQNLEKEEIRRRKREEPLSIVSDWEKGRLKKVFKTYDKDKKALIKQEDLKNLYADLQADKANLGKVPQYDLEIVLQLTLNFQFIQKINKDNSTTITWDSFCFNLNQVMFQKAPQEILAKKIDDKYYEFNKKINTGKLNEGKEILFDVIRLENARDLDESSKYIVNKQLIKKDIQIDNNQKANKQLDKIRLIFLNIILE